VATHVSAIAAESTQAASHGSSVSQGRGEEQQPANQSGQRLLEEAQRRHLEAQSKALEQSRTDIVLELRTLARLTTFGEQDAAHLRAAADEIERLRGLCASLDGECEDRSLKQDRATFKYEHDFRKAVAAERAAILAEVEKLANGADWLAVIDLAAANKARGDLR
jgi:hypothetical protein